MVVYYNVGSMYRGFNMELSVIGDIARERENKRAQWILSLFLKKI